MILGLSFTQAIGIDIEEFLVNIYKVPNGTDSNNQVTPNEVNIRRVRHAQMAGYYVQIQIEPRDL